MVYWMSRDQRAQDNWALLYAQKLALEKKQPLVVVFCLLKDFLGAGDREFGYMINGLKHTEKRLKLLNIPFVLIKGRPEELLPKFAKKINAGALVTDFSPLKAGRVWREAVAKKIKCIMYEVDAHNIVPVWVASQKQEYGAFTLRPKIHKLLPEFLDDFPKLKKQSAYPRLAFGKNLWPKIKFNSTGTLASNTATEELQKFITTKINKYAEHKNDPNKDAQSELSVFLHFGQISPQRVALEILSLRQNKNTEAFLEELVVRRELSDNFCFYNINYDNFFGFPVWAQKTLAEHKNEKRQYLYSLKVLQDSKTHDRLWNAAQQQMVKTGKMHGYMRMYWAKKILEWTKTPRQAQKYAIYLNDKYSLDGRDPNGYTGIAWSIGGLHDRAWFDRPIFGKIRYMSYNGCKGKFDIEKYIRTWLD